jgi:hypothetical protein
MARRRQAPGTWAVFYQQRLFLRPLLLSPDRRGRHVRGGRGRECRGTSFSPIALRILTATRPVVGRRYLQNAAVDPASRHSERRRAVALRVQPFSDSVNSDFSIHPSPSF